MYIFPIINLTSHEINKHETTFNNMSTVFMLCEVVHLTPTVHNYILNVLNFWYQC